MKVIIALAAIMVVSYAASLTGDRDAYIVRSDFDNIGVDGFQSSYETSNGISSQEQGQVQNQGRENEAIAVRGQYQYVGPDGVTYSVQYIADENGFQPQGAHLPVAPQ